MSEIRIFKISILVLGIVLPILPFFFFRNKRKEVALLLFSFAFSFFLIEGFFRQFYPQLIEHDQMFEYDPYLGWRFIPNKKALVIYADEARHYVKINSLGFRDHSSPSDKDDHQKMLIVGDSFVTNIAVKDSQIFTEVMERSLKNTSVLNFGVNGYGQVQEYLLLEKWLDKINPDLVILMIYIRNDFIDNIGGYWLHPRPFVSWSEDNSKLLFHSPPESQPEKETSFADILLKLLKKMHCFEFLNTRFNILFDKYFYPDQSKHKPSIHKAPEFYLCHTQTSQNTQLMNRTMEALLMRIADYVVERQAQIVFALAPSITQVEDKLWENTILNNSEEPKNYTRSLPNDGLMQFAEKNNLLMIDLLPILQSKSNNGKPCYNLREQHWNEEGNQVVAHALINYLKGKKLLKYRQ